MTAALHTRTAYPPRRSFPPPPRPHHAVARRAKPRSRRTRTARRRTGLCLAAARIVVTHLHKPRLPSFEPWSPFRPIRPLDRAHEAMPDSYACRCLLAITRTHKQAVVPQHTDAQALGLHRRPPRGTDQHADASPAHRGITIATCHPRPRPHTLQTRRDQLSRA